MGGVRSATLLATALRFGAVTLRSGRGARSFSLRLGLVSGLPYYNHGQSIAPGNAFYALRDLGDSAAVAALCPRRPPHPDLEWAVQDVAHSIRYSKHATCAPINLIHAHALCGSQGEISP